MAEELLEDRVYSSIKSIGRMPCGYNYEYRFIEFFSFMKTWSAAISTKMFGAFYHKKVSPRCVSSAKTEWVGNGHKSCWDKLTNQFRE